MRFQRRVLAVSLLILAGPMYAYGWPWKTTAVTVASFVASAADEASTRYALRERCYHPFPQSTSCTHLYEGDPLAKPFVEMPSAGYFATGGAVDWGLNHWARHHGRWGMIAQTIQTSLQLTLAVRNVELVRTQNHSYDNLPMPSLHPRCCVSRKAEGDAGGQKANRSAGKR